MEIWGATNGLHASLREGAKLVETAADVFEEFGVAVLRSGEKALLAPTSTQHEMPLENINYVPAPIGHIVKSS